MLAESQLVDVAQDKLTMLKHVLRVNVLHSIIDCVNVRVPVLKGGLEDECGGETVPRC